METTLHRQLKALYAATGRSRTEVRLDAFRIDVVRRGELIEIQHGSLAALRDKARHLLAAHRLRIVKPIVQRKTLIRLDSPGGRELSRRLSPRRGSLLTLFDELVHFTRVFPHEGLVIEVLLVDIEEYRFPGHGRRRRWRKSDYQIEDQKLLTVGTRKLLSTAADLKKLLPAPLPREFHTGDLATKLGVRRWEAQRIAYCLRQAGTVQAVGKQGNAVVYRTAA